MQPLTWKDPAKVFVENQSDLFGEWVRAEHIDRVFAVMSVCEKHTFQVLTKRPERMLEYVRTGPAGIQRAMAALGHEIAARHLAERWPLPNLWLGVSAEDQAAADRRIPLLLRSPAAVRFVSYEPALGPVDFRRWLTPGSVRTRSNFPRDEVRTDKLDWIIVGGESGPRSRPFDIAWARQTIDDCQAADVACFVKQLGAKPQEGESAERAPAWLRLTDRKGGDLTAWPESLRVRQFPGRRTMTA
jgi:protein gp37